MKKLLCCLILMMGCVSSTVLSYAEDECVTVTYYSKKEWVNQNELIDVAFNNTHDVINSKGLGISFNIFGTRDYEQKASSANFNGQEIMLITSTKTKYSPNYFYISFSDHIYIDELQLDIKALTANNETLIKQIYVNAEVREHASGLDYVYGKFIGEYSDNVTNIKLDEAISSIVIWYEDISMIDEIVFNGFSVNNYQALKHVAWSTEAIEDTEIYSRTICAGKGEYYPDGTSWQKEITTTFTASIEAINHEPTLINNTYFVDYDFGKKEHIEPYSTPWIMKEEVPFGADIKGFSGQWKSYGEGGIAHPYIMVSDDTGIVYLISSGHWTASYKGSNYYSHSYNKEWCNAVLGNNTVPCYKYGGHTNNTRGNVYTIIGQMYSNITPPELQNIGKVDYYLVNEDTGAKQLIRTVNDDSMQDFMLQDSGRWRIESIIYDLANNKGSIISEVFHIDSTIPNVIFSSDAQKSTQSIAVNIGVDDKHSGVLKWRYTVDNGEGYGDYSAFIYNDEMYTLTLQESGQHKIKVHVVDHVGNENVVESSVFQINKASASVAAMYSTPYQKSIENTLHVKLVFEEATEANDVRVSTYLDGELIKQESTNREHYQVNYNSSNEDAVLKVVISSDNTAIQNKAMSLYVKAVTREHLEGNNLSFKEDSMFMSNEQGQMNFQEELIVQLRKDKEAYYSGEGIDVVVDTTYYNACATVKNWVCVSDTVLNPGNSQFIFDNATKQLDEIYKEGSVYVVTLEYDRRYQLPQYYANKRTGDIYLSSDVATTDEIILAYRRWYTDKQLVNGEYLIQNKANNVGVNQFSWFMTTSYSVVGNVLEQFRIRFVDPSKPFVNGESKMWQNKEEWIKQFE